MNRYPVVVIGTGPTGLLLANFLGLYGIRTLVLERLDCLLDEPRAVSIDDESLRALQAVGLAETVLPSIVQGYGVHYFSYAQAEFARIEPKLEDYGFPKRNAFRQAVLVEQLAEGLKRFPQVELRFQHDVIGLTQSESGVSLEVNTPEGLISIEADYVVGADGGRSSTRERIGSTLEGHTFAERWLIVDLLSRSTPFRHTRTYCDPVRPAIRLPGPDGTVRYEFMLKPGEDDAFALDQTRIKDWIRMREPSDENLPLARKVVYTFHARIASRWQQGRVFLAGDAAHLTPPFAGQGMNSGLRDVVNLSWKLASVVKGCSSPALLDTYQQERKPHAWALIQMAVRIGKYMQPKSRLGAMVAQWALKLVSLYRPAKDYVLQLKFKPKPRFEQGFFVPQTLGNDAVYSGQLLPQPWMEAPGGRKVRLDERLGSGFALLWKDQHALPAAWQNLARQLDARVVRLVPDFDDFLPERVVEEGGLLRDMQNVLHPLLAQAGAAGVLLRPDRYVFAYLDAQAEREPAVVRALNEAGWKTDKA